jgi:hypothetical protein
MYIRTCNNNKTIKIIDLWVQKKSSLYISFFLNSNTQLHRHTKFKILIGKVFISAKHYYRGYENKIFMKRKKSRSNIRVEGNSDNRSRVFKL